MKTPIHQVEIERGEPVTSPGVSKNYPTAKKLVTEDCIQPSILALNTTKQ